MEKIVCRAITGPTASGKSALALRLAREMGWEILCMDSMQVYRRMDIGTAKPTAEERRLVPHHLLDLLDPRDSFSVSEYREAAEAAREYKLTPFLEMLEKSRADRINGAAGIFRIYPPVFSSSSPASAAAAFSGNPPGAPPSLLTR